MLNKLLLSTVATTALLFSTSAIANEDGKKHDEKEHVHCDRTKDKDCKDEHEHGKDGDKHDDHKEGENHGHADGKKD